MGGDDVVEEWVIAIRICGAAALAAIVGFEREARYSDTTVNDTVHTS